MQIVELDADGVIADRLDRQDADMRAARDQLLLAGPMALDLGRRAFDPQIFRRQAETLAVLEIDLETLSACLRRISVGQTPLKNSGSRLAGGFLAVAQDPRLVGEHDRNAVADGIGQARLDADQFLRRAVPDWSPYAGDLVESENPNLDRARLLKALGPFLVRHGVKTDPDSVQSAPLARLVDAVSMMAPFAPREKQALLEAAPDARALLLTQLIEMSLLADAAPVSGASN